MVRGGREGIGGEEREKKGEGVGARRASSLFETFRRH